MMRTCMGLRPELVSTQSPYDRSAVSPGLSPQLARGSLRGAPISD